MESLKNSKKYQRKHLKRRLVGGFILLIVAGFLTWFGISYFSIDTELKLTKTYSLPEFADLTNLPEVQYGDMAVAIDGQPVAGKYFGADAVAVRPTASTAKMILALAVMQAKPFSPGERGETITITPEMVNLYNYYAEHNGTNTKVESGKVLSEYDALASIMLASSNNMADSLAIWAFGSLDNYRAYAEKMLNDWGIINTTIGVDASGYNESTTSTAEDLARIGEKVLNNPVLAEIVNTKAYVVPMAGYITNTNKLLGKNDIIGVKTGFIGEESGYCLVSGYKVGEHVVTVALMGAPTREVSFDDSLQIVSKMQELVNERQVVTAGGTVGYYDSWWTGTVKITADSDLRLIGWKGMNVSDDLEMSGEAGLLKIKVGADEYTIGVHADDYQTEPSFGEKISHIFGWQNDNDGTSTKETDSEETDAANTEEEEPDNTTIKTNAESANCTVKLGALMLINPNFTVEDSFIATRGTELISLATVYGIQEGVAGNGDNLLDSEAASHINDMIKAYEADYPGHTMETRSCFRAQGTKCGRLCAATGASDHHTGLTCDLLDPAYGTSLDTSTYEQHIDWQWLRDNSYKYGFIDRFPEAWAGGSMDEPLNVNEEGSTGLFETWHYRYVGTKAAKEIATGKYNNGQYDSLEHYLKARGFVSDLKAGTCE